MSDFLVSPLPYCEGCGHRLVANKTIQVLEELQISPHDVVMVSDIGCHGIIDKSLATHTIHGLHGRSVALGVGITLGLAGTNKKVIVFIGDGGATIGLQHLLEAARRNINLMVVVHNNMLYGMTGGQPSALTLPGYRTPLTPKGSSLPNYDLCQLIHQAGASYVCRAISGGNLLNALRTAFATEGFCMVEVLGLCVERGRKLNKNLKLKELASQAGLAFDEWRGESRTAFHMSREEKPSLLDKENDVVVDYASPLKGRQSIVLGGSAGEGVQKAAELFVHAALSCGLHVTKKGSYPVTVGVGFSTAEIILSRDPIEYHGITQPDNMILVSEDGLNHNLTHICAMKKGTVWCDEAVWLNTKLELDAPFVKLIRQKFRELAGPKNAALYALLCFVDKTGILPMESILKTIDQDSIRKYIPPELLQTFRYSQ